jgi:hypothetical protein
MKIKLLVLSVFMIGGWSWSLRADDITLAKVGNLAAGGQYKMFMICRKDTTKTNSAAAGELKKPYNWYVEKENELYTAHHDPTTNKFVYYVGSYESPQVITNPVLDPTKKISDFKQDSKAAPAECRLYFVVRYP